MKATKYLAILLTIVAILLATAWYLRDSLIRRFSNPILAEYGLQITDISLDTLARSDAGFSYLELEHDNGTVVAIEDLSLPLARSSTGTTRLLAEKVTITPTEDEDAPPREIVQAIDQVLALPDERPRTDVGIAEFEMAPYPVIRDLRWVSAEDRQALAARIETVLLSTAIVRVYEAGHEVIMSLRDADDPTREQTLTAKLDRTDTGFTFAGATEADLTGWLPLVSLFELVPEAVQIDSGTASLAFKLDVPSDARRLARVDATVTPTTPVQLRHTGADGAESSISVQEAAPVTLTMTLPLADWNLRGSSASLLVTYDDWRDILVSVIDLDCESAHCTTRTLVSMDVTNTPLGDGGWLELGSQQELTFSPGDIRIDVASNAAMKITDYVLGDTAIGRVDAELVSAGSVSIADEIRTFRADRIDANIIGLKLTDDLEVSVPVALEHVVSSEIRGQMAVDACIFAPSSIEYRGDSPIAAPGIRCRLQAAVPDDFAGEPPGESGEIASLQVLHDLNTEHGQMTLRRAGFSFVEQNLSKRIAPWPSLLEISAGTVTTEARAEWERQGEEFAITGQSSIGLVNLAGAYDDIAFAGLSTDLEARYDSEAGITLEPTSISIDLIEAGLPVEDITADVTFRLDPLSADVETLTMSSFGGTVTAEPFSFDTGRERNTLTLKAESLDISEVLLAQEFEAVSMTGRIGATLPVIIEGDSIRIEGGTLEGEAPGGVISYGVGDATQDTDPTAVDIARQALSNFQYESLTSEVDYGTNGDLKLGMRLEGRNPDLQGSRTVILNLNVENNVPQMLKSLRAARAVEEILERQLRKDEAPLQEQ